jgi:hypothetical protein
MARVPDAAYIKHAGLRLFLCPDGPVPDASRLLRHPAREQGDPPGCSDAASDSGLSRGANRRMLRPGSYEEPAVWIYVVRELNNLFAVRELSGVEICLVNPFAPVHSRHQRFAFRSDRPSKNDQSQDIATAAGVRREAP